jgi:hypothetical protein
MPHRQIFEVSETLATFRSLLDTHSIARNRLIERRAEAIGEEQIHKLDHLLAINGRTIEAVKRATETLESQLRQLKTADSRISTGR